MNNHETTSLGTTKVDGPANADSSRDPSRLGRASACADTVLDVRNLHAIYDAIEPVRALSDVSLTVRRGEVLGVAGESGSGKSTLLTAIARLERPPAKTAAGEIVFYPAGGQPVDLVRASEPELRTLRWSHLSVVFQSAMNALNPVRRLSAQFIDAIRAHEPVSKKQALARAVELLHMVGIPGDRVRSFPHELSGGMRQRAMIALSMACEPDLVLMDEPTTAVDVVMQRAILNQLLMLQRTLGFSVIFVTHDLSLLIDLADRIAVMYGGEVVELGGAQDLYHDPRHPYTRALRDSFPPLHGPRRELHGIPGTPPDLQDLPDACLFAPRCPDVTEACRTERPASVIRGERRISCTRVSADRSGQWRPSGSPILPRSQS